MTSRIACQLRVLFAASLGLTACATAGGSDPRPAHSAFGAANVLTRTDIHTSGAATAYEALERLRPVFLISKVDLAPLREREVFLNGVRLGGIAELRLIPASAVQEIRFVRAIDGGGTGSGRGAAILVISKAGR